MKSKITTYVDKYKKLLGLENYYIDIAVADCHYISDYNGRTKKADCDYMAEVIKGDNPKSFTLVINKSALNSGLEDTILHELLHVLLWEYTELMESISVLADLDDGAKAKMYNGLGKIEHEIVDKLIKTLK